MPRFWLRIQGDDLWRAMGLLDGASIRTIAVSEGYFGNQPPPDLSLFRLTAVVDADTEEDAKSRVTRILPEGFNVERVEQTYVVKKKWPERGREGYFAGGDEDLRMAIKHAERLDADRGSDNYEVNVLASPEGDTVWSSAWREERRAEAKRMASRLA
ncbi:MAG: hypothetical protein ICV69_05715 [Thermoleophilaceae bacterium]|nr:hypothetical protein [Thermoleophilaceae bacterium]